MQEEQAARVLSTMVREPGSMVLCNGFDFEIRTRQPGRVLYAMEALNVHAYTDILADDDSVIVGFPAPNDHSKQLYHGSDRDALYQVLGNAAQEQMAPFQTALENTRITLMNPGLYFVVQAESGADQVLERLMALQIGDHIERRANSFVIDIKNASGDDALQAMKYALEWHYRNQENRDALGGSV